MIDVLFLTEVQSFVLIFPQMAVAAAIGVGDSDQEGDVMSSRLANATNRLSGKRSLLRSTSGIPTTSHSGNSAGAVVQSQQQRIVQQQGLSEINRSIEKMTLQPMNNGESSSSHR